MSHQATEAQQALDVSTQEREKIRKNGNSDLFIGVLSASGGSGLIAVLTIVSLLYDTTPNWSSAIGGVLALTVCSVAGFILAVKLYQRQKRRTTNQLEHINAAEAVAHKQLNLLREQELQLKAELETTALQT
ncbi:MAG: hypothetical protein M3R24_05795 [Chloroflexota bacterium]|nr:hypothetical protein [Chloroflexota bacterium]